MCGLMRTDAGVVFQRLCLKQSIDLKIGLHPLTGNNNIMAKKRTTKKKKGTKLCARGKAAAKAKYKVYPSAYANGYAVQVCKGTKPGAGGKKKTASGYSKGRR